MTLGGFLLMLVIVFVIVLFVAIVCGVDLSDIFFFLPDGN
jgi:hypothetical protein